MENLNKHLKVEIVSATEHDPIRAAALLIFTKSTRLKMVSSGLDDIVEKCESDPRWMHKELDYMSKTIRSSWEFLDVTFSIENVSRACAQQITRTRFTPIDGDLFGSYAMQSQRVTDMSEATWHNPIRDNGKKDDVGHAEDFDNVAGQILENYAELVREDAGVGSEHIPGMSLEDARGILPMNLHCSLVAKYNLRLLADLLQARSSYRAQGEFNQVAMLMREALIGMWPWVEMFLRPRDELAKLAFEDFRGVIRKHCNEDNVGVKGIHEMMIHLAKVEDLLQGNK